MQKTKNVSLLITVAALGYFVDIYDLILFNVIKLKSLEALGITGQQQFEYEKLLFNCQMGGMLIGGILWGILGDKKGRVSVLFGSILLYSLANIVNAFATGIVDYSIYRFIAGVGLAGELGAGITLVAETMHREKRGYGTMIIVTFGALGAVLAATIGKEGENIARWLNGLLSVNLMGWQIAYLLGGILGMLLLLMRAGAYESGMFESLHKTSTVPKGAFLSLFTERKRFVKYLNCILIGLPIWFVVGVLINFSHKFYAETFAGLEKQQLVADAIMYTYLGLSFGDLISGLLSQWFRNRKKIVLGYIIGIIVLVVVYLLRFDISYRQFNLLCFLLGSATGYWALFVTIAAEQFGTNLRSTVTSTVPNFVRGAVVPITFFFGMILNSAGAVTAAIVVGSVCLGLAFIATLAVPETFDKDLDYLETI